VEKPDVSVLLDCEIKFKKIIIELNVKMFPLVNISENLTNFEP